MIKGIEIIAYIRQTSGKDELGNEIFKKKKILLENVLVSPAESDDMLGTANLNTDRIAYQLAIPKKYNDIDFSGAHFEFFSKKFKIVSIPYKGIDELIPLKWNKKIQVENYE